MIVTFSITAGIPAVANAQPASPIFGDVTIKHPFSPDPLTVRGMSGGSIPATQIAGKKETQPTGPCKGFVDLAPDHTLNLISKFDYLKLVVQSPADTTMIIKGPGGTWCNDDFDGKNPGIVGEWLPGKYQIWIGSYEKNDYLPYTLQITEVK
ncbi:hypothetical protein FJR38_02190 [Anabaena sp. UHCC 0253]|nr:hypothetical protein [Anabaena sp. UHCC 0204]MTJ51577.1 hypothetical protein [Anabaena sp. UHCC 0253]